MDIKNDLISGRPYGGLAILWSKRIGHLCKPVFFGDETRLMGLELKVGNVKYFFINVYMPYCCVENQDYFTSMLSNIDSIIASCGTSYVFIVGDFNADPTKSHLFGRELSAHCSDQNLFLSDISHLHNCYTFYSSAHDTTSWLDHVMCTINAHQLVSSCRVYYDKITSDHFPLSFNVNINCTLPTAGTRAGILDNKTSRVRWDKLSEEQISQYAATTERLLKALPYNASLCSCDNNNCRHHDHVNSINKLYEDICDIFHHASKDFITTTQHNAHQIPGWSEYCKDLHTQARGAFLLWRSHGSQRQGPIYENMKKTRARFKHSLRQCKRAKDQMNMDQLAEQLLSKDTKAFWKGVRKTHGYNTQDCANTIADHTGPQNISDMWYSYYKDLLNSTNNNDTRMKDKVLNKLKHIQKCDLFTPADIADAVKKLKKETSPGMDGISSEHLLYAHQDICTPICVLFNSMLTHNYLPPNFMSTMLIPILKDNKRDNTVCDNYRPVAVTSVFSKIFELILLKNYSDYLYSSDHQFGFKRKHSTDQCVFIIKELIDFYISSGSPLYVCFMDASKAFDRINHYRLFDNLLIRGMPVIIVRLLYTWYSTQLYYVKWCNTVSQPFSVSNGVRQGGILSPVLFNVYNDNLSQALNDLKVGCFINNVCMNHIFYADDIALISPSPAALQQMVKICEVYGKNNEIIYSTEKTTCMAFIPKYFKQYNVPNIYLNGNPLQWVNEHKYLGFYFTTDNSDVKDMKRQLRYLYCRGNILYRKFYKSDDNIKLILFRTYCYNLYCAQLWCNYPESAINSVKVAYNNNFRNLFGIKKQQRISMSELYLHNCIDSFPVLLRKSTVNFRSRLYNSNNILIKTILDSLFMFSNSKLYNTWCKRIF